jgi:hypothetical protein
LLHVEDGPGVVVQYIQLPSQLVRLAEDRHGPHVMVHVTWCAALLAALSTLRPTSVTIGVALIVAAVSMLIL